MKKYLLALLILATGQVAMAADPIAARKQVFEQYKKTMGAMGKMVKGEVAFNQDDFAKLAAHMDELATQPWPYFTPGSGQGKTDARPEIWSKPAEFKNAANQLKAETAKLKQAASAAKSADDIKAPFGAVQKTCKACHDQFRAD